MIWTGWVPDLQRVGQQTHATAGREAGATESARQPLRLALADLATIVGLRMGTMAAPLPGAAC